MSAEQHFDYTEPDDKDGLYAVPNYTAIPVKAEAEGQEDVWEQFQAFVSDPNRPRFGFEMPSETGADRLQTAWQKSSYQEPLKPVDLSDLERADMRNLTLVIHRFAARGGHDIHLREGTRTYRVPKPAKARGSSEEPAEEETATFDVHLLSVPESSIARGISDFYKQNGTDLNPADRVKNRKIREYLSGVRITYDRVAVYEDDPVRAVPRHDMYPEFRLAEDLMDEFDARELDRASEATVVLLASYGNRILHFAAMAGQQAMQDRASNRVRRIDESSIPKGFRAEETRRPRQ